MIYRDGMVAGARAADDGAIGLYPVAAHEGAVDLHHMGPADGAWDIHPMRGRR
jgi:hypothetical protein